MNAHENAAGAAPLPGEGAAQDPAQQDPTQPGAAQPGAAQPGAAQPGAAQPDPAPEFPQSAPQEQPEQPEQPAQQAQQAHPAAAAPAPASAPAPAPRRKPAPRTGPIVWGALVLAFCGYIAQRMLGTDGFDAATWIAATTIGLGVLLLGVGAAVLIRNRRR